MTDSSRLRGAGPVSALVSLCAITAGCTAGGTTGATGATGATPAATARSSTGGRPGTGPVGSAGNPLTLSCGEESFTPGSPPPQRPGPADLGVGPLYFPGGRKLATADPAGYGEHGSYKIPLALAMGTTATVTIAPPARGRVVISNPYSPVGGVTSATYHSCSTVPGFFAQSLAFVDGQTRGCVPLDITIDGQRTAHRIMFSLFAGACAR